jgi:flagellar hook-length control protein FliK
LSNSVRNLGSGRGVDAAAGVGAGARQSDAGSTDGAFAAVMSLAIVAAAGVSANGGDGDASGGASAGSGGNGQNQTEDGASPTGDAATQPNALASTATATALAPAPPAIANAVPATDVVQTPDTTAGSIAAGLIDATGAPVAIVGGQKSPRDDPPSKTPPQPTATVILANAPDLASIAAPAASLPPPAIVTSGESRAADAAPAGPVSSVTGSSLGQGDRRAFAPVSPPPGDQAAATSPNPAGAISNATSLSGIPIEAASVLAPAIAAALGAPRPATPDPAVPARPLAGAADQAGAAAPPPVVVAAQTVAAAPVDAMAMLPRVASPSPPSANANQNQSSAPQVLDAGSGDASSGVAVGPPQPLPANADDRRDDMSAIASPAAPIIASALPDAPSPRAPIPTNIAAVGAPLATPVSGTVNAPASSSGDTTGSTGISDSGAFADAVAQRVIGLIANGHQEATLQLQPPQLGDLTVRIAVQGHDVSTWFAAAQPQVQVAVSQALDQLRADLAGAGFNLAGAWVGADASAMQQGAYDGNAPPSRRASYAPASIAPAAIDNADASRSSGLSIYV